MRSSFLVLIALAMTLAFGASAQATVIAVTPENMESLGWSIEVNTGARPPGNAIGELTTWGPCVWEHNGFVSESSVNFGRGAFYAECSYGGITTADKTPDSVWLGTDTHCGKPLAGVTLNQIKTMNYYSYASRAPTRSNSAGSFVPDWTSRQTAWQGPNSPIMLQITAASADGGDYKQFWIRPRSWGARVQGPDGGMDGDIEGCWQNLNGISDRWYHAPERQDLSDEAEWTNWASLCATYGDYRLIATSTAAWGSGGIKSPGWDNSTVPRGYFYTTGTGKCLNFEIGARKFKGYLWFQGGLVNWYVESMGFRGHVDYFTLGIDKNADGDDYDTGEQATYNFEPSASEPDPEIVAASLKSLNNNPLLPKRFTKSRFMYKAVGKVVDRSGNPHWCQIEDGSGLNTYFTGDPPEPFKVSAEINLYLPYLKNPANGLPAGMWVGSYWSAWGYVERLRGVYTTTPPLMLWTGQSHMKQFFE